MALSFELLGDPHLGRKFRTGVPLDRMGEREELQLQEFTDELCESSHEANLHICMGDLFDKFVVAPEIVLAAAGVYRMAASMFPQKRFIVLQGNHDTSRNSTRASSFDLFAAIVADIENITVVRDEPMVIGQFGFVPYSAFKPTAELVAQLPDNLDAVFGHWDVVDFGGDNVIPTKLLAKKGIDRAYTGHDHLARIQERDGVEIFVTGSMQPYSHAEDPDGRLYRTVTLEELATLDTRDLNIRVRLKEGETLPTDLDCLSLTAIRGETETYEVDTSDFESLDVGQMLASVLEGLSIKDAILEKFHDA